MGKALHLLVWVVLGLLVVSPGFAQLYLQSRVGADAAPPVADSRVASGPAEHSAGSEVRNRYLADVFRAANSQVIRDLETQLRRPLSRLERRAISDALRETIADGTYASIRIEEFARLVGERFAEAGSSGSSPR